MVGTRECDGGRYIVTMINHTANSGQEFVSRTCVHHSIMNILGCCRSPSAAKVIIKAMFPCFCRACCADVQHLAWTFSKRRSPQIWQSVQRWAMGVLPEAMLLNKVTGFCFLMSVMSVYKKGPVAGAFFDKPHSVNMLSWRNGSGYVVTPSVSADTTRSTYTSNSIKANMQRQLNFVGICVFNPIRAMESNTTRKNVKSLWIHCRSFWHCSVSKFRSTGLPDTYDYKSTFTLSSTEQKGTIQLKKYNWFESSSTSSVSLVTKNSSWVLLSRCACSSRFRTKEMSLLGSDEGNIPVVFSISPVELAHIEEKVRCELNAELFYVQLGMAEYTTVWKCPSWATGQVWRRGALLMKDLWV